MFVFNILPESFKLKGAYTGMEFRPQVSIRGTAPVFAQKPSLRYQAEQAKLKDEEQALAPESVVV